MNRLKAGGQRTATLTNGTGNMPGSNGRRGTGTTADLADGSLPPALPPIPGNKWYCTPPNGMKGLLCHNIPISNQRDPKNSKVDYSRQEQGLRGERIGSDDEHANHPCLALAVPKLNDANASTLAACQPPSLVGVASSSSKFHQQSRSHSFEGPTDCHCSHLLERQEEETSTSRSSNLSLRYFITISRARQGIGRPHSANTSPGNFSSGRRLVKLNPHQHHHDLAKVVGELQSYQRRQPDDRDNPVRQAIVDVANHCLRKTGKVTSSSKTRLSSEAIKWSPASPTSQRNNPLGQQRNKSRRLSPSASFVQEEAPPEVKSPPTPRTRNTRVLHLPDPSNIANRRILFTMSRKMCSRSSIQSFQSRFSRRSSNLSSSPDEGEAGHVPLATNTPNASVHGGQKEQESRPTSPTSAIRECLVANLDKLSAKAKTVKPRPQASTAEGDDAAYVSTTNESIMSVEAHHHPQTDDDDCDGDSILSLSSLPSKRPSVEEDDDDDSIAFSMDSVHMRKKQFEDSYSSSQSNTALRKQSARSWRTDWAVNSSTQSSQVPVQDGAPAPVPPQQIVCEDSILQRRFQIQTRLWDDNGDPKKEHDRERDDDDNADCSLASLSSLDTTERLEELDPLDSQQQVAELLQRL